MPRHIETVTPENVRIEYELAGFASRCGAALVDLVLQALAITAVVLIFLLIEIALHLSIVGMPTAVVIVSTFLLWWGYYVFFETVWNGQTPGKRLLRLRVVRYGGSPIDLTSAGVRGLIRIVDMAVVGFVAMFVTPNNQRLGDLAAGTVVVKERSQWTGHIEQPRQQSGLESPEAAIITNIELVTPDQFEAVQRFVLRCDELAPQVREQIAGRLARPLMQHLGIEHATVVSHTDLLKAIHDKCVSERGMR